MVFLHYLDKILTDWQLPTVRVFYTKTTNENGTAKLNINLPPGEYILTAIDSLTGLQMSYNITVLPTLNATDLEMTYKDGSTFNVTVLDGQGKPLANAKVTFNINGVFYNKISDSNGIARLNINLMPGEYIITSEYENLRISNKITIAAKDDWKYHPIFFSFNSNLQIFGLK